MPWQRPYKVEINMQKISRIIEGLLRANKYRSIFIIFQNNVEHFMLQYMCITKYKAEQ